MFLYIGWQDSLEVHPFNRPNDFIVDLPKSLLLQGKWEVALTDIKVKAPKKSTFYVLADFCEESFLKGSQYPVLRRVDGKEAQYTLPYFVETNKSEVRSIRLSILDQNLKPYQLSDIECTLYLRKKYVDTQRLPSV